MLPNIPEMFEDGMFDIEIFETFLLLLCSDLLFQQSEILKWMVFYASSESEFCRLIEKYNLAKADKIAFFLYK